MYRISHWISRFFSEDTAQDLVEYSLLIAFMAMAAVGVLSQMGVTIQGPWGTANTTLATANGTQDTAPASSGDKDPRGGHDNWH